MNEDGVHEFDNIQIEGSDRKEVFTANLTFEAILPENFQEKVVICCLDILSKEENKKIHKHTKDEGYEERIQKLESEVIKYKKILQRYEVEDNERVREMNNKNRDIMVSNEELQSTNEELQSVNVELHTVNAELQHKNKQLAVANNDISNLLKSTNIGTIFIDKNLKIRRFTPAVKKQFNIIESDIGRSITTFSSNVLDIDIDDVCRKVLDTTEPIRQVVADNNGKEYLMRASLYRTIDDEINGVVLTFVDLSKTKTMLKKYDHTIEETANKFNAIFENSKNTMLFIDEKGIIQSANGPFAGEEQSDLVNKSIFELGSNGELNTLKKTISQVFKEQNFKTADVEFDEQSLYYKLDLVPIDKDKLTDRKPLVCIIGYDNSNEQNYLRSLENTKDTFTSFMDNAQHQMVLLNDKGEIVYINSDKSSPLTKEQLIGSSIYDQIPPDQVASYRRSIEEIFEGISNSKISFVYEFPDGRIEDVSVMATPVVINGDIEYVALIGNPL